MKPNDKESSEWPREFTDEQTWKHEEEIREQNTRKFMKMRMKVFTITFLLRLFCFHLQIKVEEILFCFHLQIKVEEILRMKTDTNRQKDLEKKS